MLKGRHRRRRAIALRATLCACFGLIVGGVILPWRFWHIHDSLRFETTMFVLYAEGSAWYGVHQRNLWSSEYSLSRSDFKGPDWMKPPSGYVVEEWPPRPPWWAPRFTKERYQSGMLCAGFGWPLRAWGRREVYETGPSGRVQILEDRMVILPRGVLVNSIAFGGVLFVIVECFLLAHRERPASKASSPP